MLDFYSEVVVIDEQVNFEGRPMVGWRGVVLGRCQEEESKTAYYTVKFAEIGHRTVSLSDRQVESTGRRFRREDFYSGEVLRVVVTEDGEGQIKE